MLTEPCAAMSMGTDVRDLTLLPPAPPVSSIPGAGGGCGMSVGGGQWTQLDLHPSSPYSTLSSHHSLIKQEPSWGSSDPGDDPHCGLGAFTLHFSGQFTGSGPCRVGAFGETTAGQPRMFSNGAFLPSCMDSPPPPRNQGTLSHHLIHSWVNVGARVCFSSVRGWMGHVQSWPCCVWAGCYVLSRVILSHVRNRLDSSPLKICTGVHWPFLEKSMVWFGAAV